MKEKRKAEEKLYIYFTHIEQHDIKRELIKIMNVNENEITMELRLKKTRK